MDAALAVIVILGFASLVTLHVTLSAMLVTQTPRWRGLAALFVPPLAPFWGFQTGRKKLSIAWIVAFVIYLVVRVLID